MICILNILQIHTNARYIDENKISIKIDPRKGKGLKKIIGNYPTC